MNSFRSNYWLKGLNRLIRNVHFAVVHRGRTQIWTRPVPKNLWGPIRSRNPAKMTHHKGFPMVKCVHGNVRFEVREKHHLDTLGPRKFQSPLSSTCDLLLSSPRVLFQPAIGDAAVLKLWWFQAPGHVFRVLNKVGRMVSGLSTSSLYPWYTDQRSLLPRKSKIDTLISSQFRNFTGFRYYFESINF